MVRIEEMIAVRAAAPVAMHALLTVARFDEWQAPDVTMVPATSAPMLAVGDRFQLEVLAGLRFDYVVEGASARDVVFAFDGPWRGHERWSFVPDGAETLVRRMYEVEEGSPLAATAWRTVGRMLVAAHYKLELPRFRAVVERAGGARAEIEAPAADRTRVDARSAAGQGTAPDAPHAPGASGADTPAESPADRPPSDGPPFPVDDA